jgi:ethanolamine utilization protein EutA
VVPAANEPRSSSFSARARSIEDSELDLTTIGVDIGSTTHHLTISHLQLKLVAGRYRLAAADLLFESAIGLTPYLEDGRIASRKVARWLLKQLHEAGRDAEEIEAGIVLLTGQALLAANAGPLSRLLASISGRLVAVGADHRLEAALAARGSGAAALSERRGTPVLNVDMGGGTTKFAVCTNGEVVQTAALDLGARLLETDAGGRVLRMQPRAGTVASALSTSLDVGQALSEDLRAGLAAFCGDRVMDVVSSGSVPDTWRDLMLTRPLDLRGEEFAVTFSGGVSEYIYGREDRQFGDLGLDIGTYIAHRVREMGNGRWKYVLEPPRGIRATALGASRYTTQVSGQTVFVVPDEVLPLRGVRVARAAPGLLAGAVTASAVAAEIMAMLDRHGASTPAGGHLAIAIQWAGPATFERVDALSLGILGALQQRSAGADLPVILLLDADVAGIVGTHLASLGVKRVVALDGVAVEEMDHLDIGAVLPGTGAVPVVITSPVLLVEGQ